MWRQVLGGSGMSFDLIETSAADARPVEIYTFARGPQEWLYTTADRDVTVATKDYLIQPIRRPGINQGGEINQSGLKLTVPRDFPIALLFRTGIPSGNITLRIQQYHEGDGEVAVVWSGRVVNVARVGDVAEILCEPFYTSVRMVGLRRRYQRQCPHVLYGSGCGVVANTYKLSTTITSVSGLNVVSADFASEADGWWEGGYLQWEISTGVYERGFIMSHVGDTLELMTAPIGLVAAMDADTFPGCDHTLGAGGCTKFSNTDSYGGFPDIPIKNPFGSDPIY